MLQNAQMALDFLRYKKIKLVNIRAEDIVDGNPKLTLGLIWTIILHFQVSSFHSHFFVADFNCQHVPAIDAENQRNQTTPSTPTSLLRMLITICFFIWKMRKETDRKCKNSRNTPRPLNAASALLLSIARLSSFSIFFVHFRVSKPATLIGCGVTVSHTTNAVFIDRIIHQHMHV